MRLILSATARIAALVGLLLVALPGAAKELYRYVNAEGNKVIAYQVPPDFVRNGYEVLSEKGVILRVVPAQLGDDERASLSEQERLAREEEGERERLRKWDEILLLRYSTV